MTVYAAKGRKPAWLWGVFPAGVTRLWPWVERARRLRLADSAWITCVLLKYRVPTGPTMKDGRAYYRGANGAAGRAAHVRAGAPARRGVACRPAQVGVIGFSAGGHLVAAVSTHFAQRTYPPVDARRAEQPTDSLLLSIRPPVTPGTDLTLRRHQRPRRRAADLPAASPGRSCGPREALADLLRRAAEGRRPYRNALIRAGGHAFACAPPSSPSAAGPRWWSSGCTPSACSALRKTEHAQSLKRRQCRGSSIQPITAVSLSATILRAIRPQLLLKSLERRVNLSRRASKAL